MYSSEKEEEEDPIRSVCAHPNDHSLLGCAVHLKKRGTRIAPRIIDPPLYLDVVTLHALALARFPLSALQISLRLRRWRTRMRTRMRMRMRTRMRMRMRMRQGQFLPPSRSPGGLGEKQPLTASRIYSSSGHFDTLAIHFSHRP